MRFKKHDYFPPSLKHICTFWGTIITIILTLWAISFFSNWNKLFLYLLLVVVVLLSINLIYNFHLEYENFQQLNDSYIELKDENKKLKERIENHKPSSSDSRLNSLEHQIAELNKKVSSIEQTNDTSSMKLKDNITRSSKKRTKSTTIRSNYNFSSTYIVDKDGLVHFIKGDNKNDN